MEELKPIGRKANLLPIEYLAGGEKKTRKFILREHTMEDIDKFVKLLVKPQNELIDVLAETVTDNMSAVAEPMRRLAEAQTELIVWLLSEPEDGGDPPNEAWVNKHVFPEMRLSIISIQEDLNGMRRLEGNYQELREMALARRTAREIVAVNSRGSKHSTVSAPATTSSRPPFMKP